MAHIIGRTAAGRTELGSCLTVAPHYIAEGAERHASSHSGSR